MGRGKGPNREWYEQQLALDAKHEAESGKEPDFSVLTAFLDLSVGVREAAEAEVSDSVSPTEPGVIEGRSNPTI
ncbi:MAG: hypothetical protein FJX77_09100 [Armatimonadetes bacterium]|nr:hypothetical protein [Armatimonadota bacterium]